KVSYAENNSVSVPGRFTLYQNYPNPFNPGTVIKYELLNPGSITLKIYDIKGKEVAVLENEFKPAGEYTINFNASDNINDLPSGIYFYRLTAGGFTESKRMLYIK
ncbi:MAG: T9SS type A sorting domain-containing protein, partial [Ignavibacteria bacterium]